MLHYASVNSENRMKFKLSIALLFITIVTTSFGAATNGLSFINDDFPKALAQAKQRKVPIFVEVWAPW